MEEQNQGWSTGKKVLVGAGAVLAATAAAVAYGGGEEALQAGAGTDVGTAVDKALDAGGVAVDEASKAATAATEAAGRTAEVIGDKAEDVLAATKETVADVAAATKETVADVTAATKETAEGVGEWVKKNPVPTAAAATAIAGTAAYIKGRSDGARKVEQAQAYA